MSNKYEHYTMSVQWSEEDQVYIVTVPELPGCKTHGETYEKAVQQAQEAIESWIEANEEVGEPIPPPQILSNKYAHYSMSIQWSEEDQVYVVTMPELPGCKTYGETYEEAVQQAREAIESWVDAMEASGQPIPAPKVVEITDFSVV